MSPSPSKSPILTPGELSSASRAIVCTVHTAPELLAFSIQAISGAPGADEFHDWHVTMSTSPSPSTSVGRESRGKNEMLPAVWCTTQLSACPVAFSNQRTREASACTTSKSPSRSMSAACNGCPCNTPPAPGKACRFHVSPSPSAFSHHTLEAKAAPRISGSPSPSRSATARF